jgi:hypothetical protein
MLPLVIQAQTATEPVLRTWTLDLAKSKYDPGPAPNSQVRTYAETPEGTKVTIKGESVSSRRMARLLP